MNWRIGEHGVLAGAVAYLIVLGWSMTNLSYDIWGFFVALPVLALLGMFGVRRMFPGDSSAILTVMYVGLAAKFAGAGARYFIAFDVYGGNSDSERYHQYAKDAAAAVWRGDASVFSVLPGGVGTRFIERFTSFVYTLAGSSKLAAFAIFAWLAFWGAAFLVKAACVAVPGLTRRRYALLCVLAPSVVYWPSSIGKEALMMFTLGVSAYGIALLLARSGFVRPILITAIGLTGAAFVRPHMAGLWLAGCVPALVVTLFRRGDSAPERRSGRRGEKLALILVIVVAAIALVSVGTATVRYLNPGGDETVATGDRISDILAETSRRTSDGTSTYPPPAVNGPADWPFASIRTLLRPLPTEARGAGQLLSALELLVFGVICIACWKRVINVPRLLIRNPYVTFAATSLFFGGLAFATFANLGILTRQKSLLFPLMMLLPCLPEFVPRRQQAKPPPSQVGSTSLGVGAQLDRVGVSASVTAHKVRSGPPSGNGEKSAIGRR